MAVSLMLPRAKREVVAYGIAMPNGSATTIGTGGNSVGSFSSAAAASEMHCSDLVWLTPSH
jgi:hypothetical protein